MGPTGKCIIVFFVVVLVVLVVALVASSKTSGTGDSGKWNSSLHENSTEDLSRSAIGNLAPPRGNVGFDRSGRPKPQWG